MIDPDVRPAGPHDVSQLAWLEAEARSVLIEQRGGPRWLDTHPARGDAWSAAIGADAVFVAHIGDVVVGYLVLVTTGPIAVVDDVYVTLQARELGFGDAMLAAAIDRARAAGCELLEGSSLPGDRDTKNLYERAGIKARLITVSTPL
ncbi:MAG: GNAT family N-acetyltransferase [Ilumatobacteraceae bacterium]|nr:GNAT family N-acetyltransferase [Ilumatobacteraceae bacterium]